MYEVIIERPRGGAGWGRDWQVPPWQQLDRDDDGRVDGGPRQRSMRPRSRSKWLSENLAPLRRFLERRVGRPWDEVYSEICAHIAVRSAVQKHVLDHLRGYVERHPVMINGWPHHPVAYGSDRGGYTPLSARRTDFYVCPETGTLLTPSRGLPEHPARVHPLGELSQLWQLHGQWFVIQLAPVPTDWQEYKKRKDVLLKRRLSSVGLGGKYGLLARSYGRPDVYAVGKLQPRAQELGGLLRQAERYAARTAVVSKK
jgi:hypothetical protein